ncbi:MAG: HemK/PrmC family methyltransferase [Candidatus Obscuribacterales bacterium]
MEPRARREAELIVEHITGLTIEERMKVGSAATHPSWGRCPGRNFGAPPATREPLQAILGYTLFRGLKFQCHRGVFIPRSDTETVVAVAQDLLALESSAPIKVLEVGLEPAPLRISLLHALPDVLVTAVEKSAAAICATLSNAGAQGDAIRGRLTVIQQDWLDFVASATDQFHLVVSNPPYIPLSETEVAAGGRSLGAHGTYSEGGDDGLLVYRQMALRGPEVLFPGGYLVVEVGDGQAEGVVHILEASHWQAVNAHLDVHGLTRAISACAPRQSVQAG